MAVNKVAAMVVDKEDLVAVVVVAAGKCSS